MFDGFEKKISFSYQSRARSLVMKRSWVERGSAGSVESWWFGLKLSFGF